MTATVHRNLPVDLKQLGDQRPTFVPAIAAASASHALVEGQVLRVAAEKQAPLLFWRIIYHLAFVAGLADQSLC